MLKKRENLKMNNEAPASASASASALAFIEEVTSKCDDVQRKMLEEIISQNIETEYLRQHGISKGSIDRQTFKSKVPLITYEDILSKILRIANGDLSPILCSHPICAFFASSGTSKGAPKMIPTIAEDMDRKHMFNSLPKHIMNQCMPELDKGKTLCFIFTYEGTKTRGGLPVSSILTRYYKSHQFRSSNTFSLYTSPEEAIYCEDAFQSMYTQMLCGLYQRNQVLCVGATFASGLIQAISFLQHHYTELCHDISTGSLSPKITDPALRARMEETFMRAPEAELAELVSHACREGDWKGIIKRLWPNTKYLEVIVTGSMGQYVAALDYYSDGLPKASVRYTTSEASIGINLNPLCDPSEVSYTVIPTMAYFEFIPLDSPCDSPSDLVDVANVQVGKEYEIVITNYAGLYRYRIGDVVLVTGFHNSSPQLKYVRRKNMLLSIDADKTDESDLQRAMEKMSALVQPLGTRVVDYTSYADVSTIPGHYVIYMELVGKGNDAYNKEVLGECCSAMEEALGYIYRYLRVKGQIGPLEIRVVKNGTFEELMEYATSRGGASINQYKVPRCVTSHPILELLRSHVLSAYFSPSLPHLHQLPP